MSAAVQTQPAPPPATPVIDFVPGLTLNRVVLAASLAVYPFTLILFFRGAHLQPAPLAFAAVAAILVLGVSAPVLALHALMLMDRQGVSFAIRRMVAREAMREQSLPRCS